MVFQQKWLDCKVKFFCRRKLHLSEHFLRFVNALFEDILHTMLGCIMKRGVMTVTFPIAHIRIKVFPDFRRILVDLHGRIFVSLLKILLELGGRASHFWMSFGRSLKIHFVMKSSWWWKPRPLLAKTYRNNSLSFNTIHSFGAWK